MNAPLFQDGSLSASALFEIVSRELLRVAMPGIGPQQIGPDSLLVEDLGVDSLHFVDLTVGLEVALGIAEFPMQDWVDRCVAEERHICVSALVVECARILCVDGVPASRPVSRSK